VTLLTHILPLMPGSLKESFCVLETGSGGESTMKDRRILMINSVLKSQCFECSENPKVWEIAVFPIKGTFGSMALNSGKPASILMT